MHYAEFAEDEVGSSVVTAAAAGSVEACDGSENVLTSAQSAALLAAIKQYDNDKWKVIGAKVGKPAKVSEVVLYPGDGFLWVPGPQTTLRLTLGLT